jgi:hypothetical protein
MWVEKNLEPCFRELSFGPHFSTASIVLDRECSIGGAPLRMLARNNKRSLQTFCLPKQFGNTEAQRTQRQSARRLRLPSAISVPYSLSLTFRLSAVDLAVPLKGIGAEKLRFESRRANFD